MLGVYPFLYCTINGSIALVADYLLVLQSDEPRDLFVGVGHVGYHLNHTPLSPTATLCSSSQCESKVL